MNSLRTISDRVLLPVALLALMFPASTYALQGDKPVTPADQNEKIADLQRQLEQLRKSDAENNQAIARIQAKLSVPRTWPETIPWFALGASGIAFAISWFFVNRQRETEQTAREKMKLELQNQGHKDRDPEITKRVQAMATALAATAIKEPSTASKIVELLVGMVQK